MAEQLVLKPSEFQKEIDTYKTFGETLFGK